MRNLAAHHPGIGLDRQHVLHADPAEDPLVGLVAAVVVLLQIRLIGVEAVRILHREFAHPDQPGARPRLVAVLGLDLVEHHRQLFVAVQLGADQMDNPLLMGHREDHRLVVAVPETEQFRADRFVPAGLFPQVGGQHHRHQHLLPLDPVHLLADDRFDLLDDPLAQRQQRVDARRNRPDITAAHQKLVTDSLGVLRIFLDPAPDQFAHSHNP